MNIPQEFKALVLSDIERIKKSINSSQKAKDLLNLHKEIDSRYQSCIANWYQGLNQVYFYADGKPPKLVYSYLEDDKDEIIDNLSMLKAKLEVYLMGMNAISLPEPVSTTVNISNNINIEVTFNRARAQIEDMTALTDEQTKEILGKITEIENTLNENGSKKSKWEKIKPVLSWLADKSFDVAMTIIPLLLKLQS